MRMAACQPVSLMASLSMRASAARWATAWNVAILRSNCSRSLT